jgi:hypothetical protein
LAGKNTSKAGPCQLELKTHVRGSAGKFAEIREFAKALPRMEQCTSQDSSKTVGQQATVPTALHGSRFPPGPIITPEDRLAREAAVLKMSKNPSSLTIEERELCQKVIACGRAQKSRDSKKRSRASGTPPSQAANARGLDRMQIGEGYQSGMIPFAVIGQEVEDAPKDCTGLFLLVEEAAKGSGPAMQLFQQSIETKEGILDTNVDPHLTGYARTQTTIPPPTSLKHPGTLTARTKLYAFMLTLACIELGLREDEYEVLEVNVLRSTTGCPEQARHVDTSPTAIADKDWGKNLQFNLWIPLGLPQCLVVWPWSHHLVQAGLRADQKNPVDAEIGGGDFRSLGDGRNFTAAVEFLMKDARGVYDHFSDGKCSRKTLMLGGGQYAAFLGSVVHAGSANDTGVPTARLHAYVVPKGTQKSPNVTGLMPPYAWHMTKDAYCQQTVRFVSDQGAAKGKGKRGKKHSKA